MSILKQLEKRSMIVPVLHGISQIMLQQNWITGVLFLIGLALGGIEFAIAALLAAYSGTGLARVLSWSEENLQMGLYGFSAALTGVAMVFYFDSCHWLTWSMVIVGGFISALLQHACIIRNIPVFTLPFILVTWGIVALLKKVEFLGSSNFPMDYAVPVGWEKIIAVSNGYGEVIFQNHPMAGMFFFVAVWIAQPRAAWIGMAASAVGVALAMAVAMDENAIHNGLFGYNAVLTAIVFSGLRKRALIWVLFGVVITLVIQIALLQVNFPGGILTFPFVVGTWIIMALQHWFRPQHPTHDEV